MTGLELSVIFFTSCVTSCAFFTVGRWVENIESSKSKHSKKQTRPSPITKEEFEKMFEEENVIDAVYEDVIDLNVYKERKIRSESCGILEYQWLYSKKDNRYVRVPRDIAELIIGLRKI